MNFRNQFLHRFLGMHKEVKDGVLGSFKSNLRKNSLGDIDWEGTIYPNGQREACFLLLDGDERGPYAQSVCSIREMLPHYSKIITTLTELLKADTELPEAFLNDWPENFYLDVISDLSDDDYQRINVMLVHQELDIDNYFVEFDWIDGKMDQPFWAYGDKCASDEFSERMISITVI